MAIQAKVNGLTTAGSFYGYDPIILLITGTNVGTADVASTDGVAAFTEGNASKAIRAIQSAASIVHIGTIGDNGFVVIVDGATASDNGEADLATRIDTLVTAATSVTTTVAVKTLALAEWA